MVQKCHPRILANESKILRSGYRLLKGRKKCTIHKFLYLFLTQDKLQHHIGSCHSMKACNECGLTFMGSNAMNKHYRNTHIKTTLRKCYVAGCDWEGTKLANHLFLVSFYMVPYLQVSCRYYHTAILINRKEITERSK